MKRLAFDRVRIATAQGVDELSVEAFLALPLPVRVKHILLRNIEFLDGLSAVDQKIALASLRDASAK